ncbi:MAG: RNA methyltransferase [Nitrospirae bacterium]|nr:RNA methyltransferase [Nitrospirota bacterium]
MKITSPANLRIKDALKVRDRQARARQDSFVIEGKHLIGTALASGAAIHEVFFTGSFSREKEGREMLNLLSSKTSMLWEVADNILARLSETSTPQGIVAVVTYTSPQLHELYFRKTPLVVVVDGIQDPGNLGTIIRTSDAAGADAVILLEGTCDARLPKVIRATAGSIFHLPVVRTDADTLMRFLAEKKIRLATTSARTGTSVFLADLREPVALVFGNEARGVRRQIEEAADLSVQIPIYGRAESLNVATSVAICLYEAVRQRAPGNS